MGHGQKRLRHGHAGKRTPTYYSWRAMITRCTCPMIHDWDRYGGRGITVCDRWRGDGGFERFLADVGERPEGMTLDRFPNANGNYEPGNVRWATPSQQAINRRQHRRRLEEHEPAQVAWLVSLGYSKITVARFFGISESYVRLIHARLSNG